MPICTACNTLRLTPIGLPINIDYMNMLPNHNGINVDIFIVTTLNMMVIYLFHPSQYLTDF